MKWGWRVVGETCAGRRGVSGIEERVGQDVGEKRKTRECPHRCGEHVYVES
jgi:hypothetical protein